MFLGKTFYSHRTSLHSGVQMGTREFHAGGGGPCDGPAFHPGGVGTFLVASFYIYRNKIRHDGPLDSYSRLNLYFYFILVLRDNDVISL